MRIRLDEGCDETNPAVVAARRLGSIGVLTNVTVVCGQSALFAKVARRCPDEVRNRVARLMQNGRWLAVGAAELLRDLAKTLHLEVEVASQERVTLQDGTAREVDVLACVGDNAMLIGCRAGPRGRDEIGRYADLAMSLGVGATNALLLAPHLEADAARDLMAFYSVSVVSREQLRDTVVRVLAELVARDGSHDRGAPLGLPAAAG